MTTPFHSAHRNNRLASVVTIICSILFSAALHAQAVSPDGLWTVLDQVEFPPRFPVPEEFTALSLDEAALDAILDSAPRENFGACTEDGQVWLPLPGGRFALVALSESPLMEAGLAAMFPEIQTFVFCGANTGRLTRYLSGAFVAGQTDSGMWNIEPVETASGRVYISYFDRHRTDGLDILVHDPAMAHDDVPPPVPRIAAEPEYTLRGNETEGIEAGEELRIYRLAASTTAEFFQGRDNGNGLLDVIFSIINDLSNANAVFEPEVSVRLILALASLDVIYDDPDTQPFDNSKAACDLRNDNRDNMMAELNDDDYDIGFLFAARSGGGANGCAWFVVCLTTNNTLHKARGAGKMGNNGANGAGGLLAHEVGHQLGARHTFTGEDGSCTENEFLAGDSESGYEPGSGTTRMSYNGNCDSDNVDVDTSDGAIGAGSYFHSRSFDEIVDNVFSGDGANCGTLVQSANQPPTVDAGPDYTIPRETPFILSGTAVDDEPLTYNWEQYDRAIEQRPINTDPGDGPIVRSIPPTTDPTRIIPNLPDLLDGIVRKGEILPETDRELNFRFIARDNQMGGGGEAYDSMVITVDGPPFFIISPNGGAIESACEQALTWQVGGGDVAAQVEALWSDDGGFNFATNLTGPIANDGSDSFIVPCDGTGAGRVKLQPTDNIFFDISDNNITVFNTAPTVDAMTMGGSVDDDCEFLVEFSATASDSCGLLAADVEVEFFQAMNNFTLGTPVVNINQVNANEVSVDGSVLVSDLTSSPAQLGIVVTATDACGLEEDDFVEALIVDDTPPEIDVELDPDLLWPPDHKLADIEATVVATDNCPGVSFVLTSVESNEPENGLGDGDHAPDIMGADLGTPDLEFQLRKERSGIGDGRVYTATYTAEDGSGNETADSATVEVPHSRK